MTLKKPVYENEANVELYAKEYSKKYHCGELMDYDNGVWTCGVCGRIYS